mmetsp:Transcript_19775/g.44410  ORF Transcript_19775/g.44410 Transcript_19775/m.44410 type:complete len:213 (-) Transcript_19775:1739-2377(-)
MTATVSGSKTSQLVSSATTNSTGKQRPLATKADALPPFPHSSGGRRGGAGSFELKYGLQRSWQRRILVHRGWSARKRTPCSRTSSGHVRSTPFGECTRRGGPSRGFHAKDTMTVLSTGPVLCSSSTSPSPSVTLMDAHGQLMDWETCKRSGNCKASATTAGRSSVRSASRRKQSTCTFVKLVCTSDSQNPPSTITSATVRAGPSDSVSSSSW